MTARLARDSLIIVVDGDEVPGLTIYGLATRGSLPPIEFPADAWLGAPEVGQYTLHGETWEVPTWDVPIIIWPTADGLAAALRVTLKAMIVGGCRVAWVGAEGLPFCDPPQLFDPACMSGGVLAWMTDAGDFDCPLDPDRPVTRASDEVLLALRSHARGLADVTDVWPD
jgi:hypothetical protein